MTVYSRSDVAAISISPAHGGCGATHTRPAPGGNPIPVWKLDCFRCEDFLRADPLWGATQGSIPETPDEKQTREAAENRTQREQLTNNVDALSRIGDALAILAQNHNNQSSGTSQVIAMLTAMLAQHGVTVPQDDPQAPAEPPADAPPPDASQAPTGDEGGQPHETGAPAADSAGPDLDAMNMNALNEYAKTLGLPGRRSRAEQIYAIRSNSN